MHADVSCPKCQRKLRVPEGFAGQAVCPACAATFEAPRIDDVPAIQPGGIDPVEMQDAFRREPHSATATPAAEPARAEAARSSRFFGSWPVVRIGLGWIMVNKGIELAVYATDLVMFALFALRHTPGFDQAPGGEYWHDVWYSWGGEVVCLRMLALLVAGFCMLVGLSQCLRYPAPGPARVVVFAAIVSFSITYLFHTLWLPFRDSVYHPARLPEGALWDWFFWAVLLVRWIAEGLLLLFLFLLGREWRHGPTLSRLRWVVALLVADVVLHLANAAGYFEKMQFVADSRLQIPEGLLVWGSVLAVHHLATAALLLRVLHTVRGALAGQGRRRRERTDSRCGNQLT